MTAEEIIKLLNLQPHPLEGGYFVESYRSDEFASKDSAAWHSTLKAYSTAIYYLLTPDTFSAMHRLPTDEVFHFYLGDPVTMLQLYPDGSSREIRLGQDLLYGQQVQVVVPKGVWQGMFLNPGGAYALLGTTMAPGFDYDDYEAGECERLTRAYPEVADIIERLTR
ncbi:MAG TPA: cupin domain-containing protein [candidate division Zixibacteria bacterium]|nr:cupin domain-containing protein [candidate division Zixibacteria bacterium]